MSSWNNRRSITYRPIHIAKIAISDARVCLSLPLKWLPKASIWITNKIIIIKADGNIPKALVEPIRHWGLHQAKIYQHNQSPLLVLYLLAKSAQLSPQIIWLQEALINLEMKMRKAQKSILIKIISRYWHSFRRPTILPQALYHSKDAEEKLFWHLASKAERSSLNLKWW
jgi:hypothetical protein